MEMSEDRQARSLRMAEVIDAYRVFPRIYLSTAFFAYCWLMAESWIWYTSIDFVAIEWANLAALTAFPLGLLTGIGGMLMSMYKDYQQSGMDWVARKRIREEFKLEEQKIGVNK